MQSETIVAQATPPGIGGVGMIRISGSKALHIAKKLIRSPKEIRPRFASFVSVYPADENDDVAIDTGILLYFKAPHSFTGEDIIELQVHGSPFVLDRIISEVLECGARLANPGEFSERAFLNDKVDLAQAEAIADLIHATSASSARLASRSLQGKFSEHVNNLSHKLVSLRLYIEASIDFSDEDIDFLQEHHIQAQFQEIDDELQSLSQGATQGAKLRESAVVVLSGPPNAGKSTLLNLLSGYESAIVHDEAGTTRDVMREDVLMDGIPIQIIDTAGLRESDNAVEKEGIRRAKEAMQRADAVLMLFDASLDNTVERETLATEVRDLLPSEVPLIRVLNKIDKLKTHPTTEDNEVLLSAKTEEGLSDLKQAIKQALGHRPSEGLYLARRRHIDALNAAGVCLDEARKALAGKKHVELLAEDLRQAHDVLCTITGSFTSDDLLGEIFSEFCIGK